MAAYRIEMSCVRKDRAALQTGLRVMRMAERINHVNCKEIRRYVGC